MREIKFRAWDKQEKRMDIPKHLAVSIGLDGAVCVEIDDDGGKSGLWEHEVPEYSSRFELMQYTGLKDKNSVEIYEGDIVLYPDTYSETVDVGVGVGLKVAETEEPSMGTVIFLEGSFCVDCTGGETLGQGKHTFDYIYNQYGFDVGDIEVIGNIYENPELL